MLLRLWRGLNDPDYKAEVEGNWKSFLAACDYHQVAPIVFHRFKGRDDIPPQVLETSVLLHSTAAAYASTWPRGSAEDFVDGAINGGRRAWSSDPEPVLIELPVVWDTITQPA